MAAIDVTITAAPDVEIVHASVTIGTCSDATVQLNGATVGTIASGATDSFAVNLDGSPSGVWDGTAWQVTSTPCSDATVELNGVEMTTIPSGDTENISIRQSSGATEVGSKQGVHWRIDDSAISINGSPVADVKAEDSLDIDVTQGGSPVGSWNGSAWIVPPCLDGIVENSDSSYSTTVASGGTLIIPDTAISANGDLVLNQPSTIAKDITVRYDTQGTVATTISGGEIVVPDVVIPDYGTRILTVLKKEYSNEVLFGFSLEYIDNDWETSSKPVINVRRSGDNATLDFTPVEITDGTLVAWVVSGGGTQNGHITFWHDQSFKGYRWFNTTSSQQGYIVQSGALSVDSNGKPTMITAATNGYTIGGVVGNRQINLFTESGNVWLVAKKLTSGLTYGFNFSGNPSIMISLSGSGAASSNNSGSPIHYINGVALASQTRGNLYTAINELETLSFVDNVKWTASNGWSSQVSLSTHLNYPIGSQVSEFVATTKDVGGQRTVIEADRNNYYNYY
jgi:hypothetical protein